MSRATRSLMMGMMVVGLCSVACTDRSTSSASLAGDRSDPRATMARRSWLTALDSLQRQVERLDSITAGHGAATPATWRLEAQRTFRHARLAWKQLEFMAEYYEPTTSRSINGAAVTEVEEDEGPGILKAPEGFQVIEERLFGPASRVDTAALRADLTSLRGDLRRLATAFRSQRLTDDRVWDAARYELARIATLGITSTDSPIARHSVPEAAAALRGVRLALASYAPERIESDSPSHWSVDSAFRATIEALEEQTDRSLDRFRWMAVHLQPLATVVGQARQQLKLATPTDHVPFRADAASIFDANALDPQGFAPPGSAPATLPAVQLGARLFQDPVLSGDGQRSCASCHLPSRAFTDGLPRNASRVPGQQLRNTPTIWNAALQVATFADLRTRYLEDQVADVIGSPAEMHGQLAQAADRLRRSADYVEAFDHAFPAAQQTERSAAITPDRIRVAVAAYLRSLTALNSRVDQALRGDTARLTADERTGFNVFVGKGKCATCHYLPLTNGTIPPTFQRAEVEILGVPAQPTWRSARVDPDSGRFRISRAPLHLYAFRTPSLRNVALTAPYMHNGVYQTLEEVVRFYNGGGGAGIGIHHINQSLPTERLGLTDAEQRALVAFMRALTDTVATTPVRAAPAASH